jgi:hypothetical protein
MTCPHVSVLSWYEKIVLLQPCINCSFKAVYSKQSLENWALICLTGACLPQSFTTEFIYVMVCRGLFEAHKMIFSFLIATAIQVSQGTVGMLTQAPAALGNPTMSRLSFLSPSQPCSTTLSSLCSYGMDAPQRWQAISLFSRLLLVFAPLCAAQCRRH